MVRGASPMGPAVPVATLARDDADSPERGTGRRSASWVLTGEEREEIEEIEEIEETR